MYDYDHRCYAQPWSEKFLFAMSGDECRDSCLLKMLKISASRVLNLKQDIPTTSCEAQDGAEELMMGKTLKLCLVLMIGPIVIIYS